MYEVKLGVIEGFYGRQWTWAQRCSLVNFLPDVGIHAYLYAPKGDRWLRSCWREPWPEHEWAQLLSLKNSLDSTSVEFGMGLTPLGFKPEERHEFFGDLDAKLDSINRLELSVLGILFDDMRGDDPELAKWQAEIANRIAIKSNAGKLILCPTFYSFDPVLEQVFGAMPKNYWVDLNTELNPDIGLFWSGNEVCSRSISDADIEKATRCLGRLPSLWDNYPVNDGRLTSNFLHTAAFSKRDSSLADNLEWHFSNPMNQFHLSLAPLSTLARIYDAHSADDLISLSLEACRSFYPGFEDQMLADFVHFQEAGLSEMSVSERQRLRQRYSVVGQAWSRELCDWLDGVYAFDPACLTG